MANSDQMAIPLLSSNRGLFKDKMSLILIKAGSEGLSKLLSDTLDSPLQGRHRAKLLNSQCTLYGSVLNQPNVHVFEMWHKARVPGENIRLHRKNMQTLSSTYVS